MSENTITPADPGVKDFSKRVSIKFKIDDDIFYGLPNLAVDQLIEFVGFTENISEAKIQDQPQFIRRVIQLALTNESAQLFIERMGNKENPISLFQAMEIIPWLMEQYGMRPTKQSSDLLDGSDSQESGTKLMDSQPTEGLTLEASPLSVS